MALLPEVDEVVAAHRVSGCRNCAATDRGCCPPLGLAAAVVDVIVLCWRFEKSRHAVTRPPTSAL